MIPGVMYEWRSIGSDINVLAQRLKGLPTTFIIIWHTWPNFRVGTDRSMCLGRVFEVLLGMR